MARNFTPLTDIQIKNATRKDKDYKIGDGQGLFLVVRKSGSKFFRFDFKYGGKYKTMSFGTYPETSLKEAREKRASAKKLLEKNINPISSKRQVKQSETITLNLVVKEWLNIRKKSASTATVIQNERTLKNVTDFLGSIAIKDIKRIDIIKQMQRIQNDRGIIETAHRLFSLLNKIYMYAVTNEYVEHNILADIDKKSVLIQNDKEKHLAAVTEEKDIKKLLNDLSNIGNTIKCDISTFYIFKIIPYVFVRSENIRLMKWDEIDFDEGLWIIPKEKMKMKISFICPLPKQAIEILKEIEPFSRHRSEFVFPSPMKNDRGISGATLSDTLVKLGYQNIHTFHGFRSMFSTVAHEKYKEHGFHSDIIEACLAHKEKNKVKAAYNRVSAYKYVLEKKELIQWYADWLDNLIKS